MRVSLRWLTDYVAIDVPVERLKDMLDLSGTKVETVHTPGDSIRGVVVAKVLAVRPHPNADTLRMVEVSYDGDASQEVVCGAHNFGVGDLVPLAGVGAKLPGMEITERKIRGEVSRGMLCSGAELGISKDHAGILVLPADATPGEDVVNLLGLDDTILELEITPNRGDCLGLIGVAREVAALLGTSVSLPDASPPESTTVDLDVSVDVYDPKACPRYLARYIEGVRVAPSPSKIVQRLLAAGIRPISNIVDATNYVLMETGQPLHAFDAAAIRDHHILVRRASAGETLVTLDDVERTLHPEDLLIAHEDGGLALAGVMGGATSEVGDSTTAVILESARFDPVVISYTSRRHGLRTEASARFERGVDPEGAAFAANRAMALILESAGGTLAADAIDAYPEPAARSVLTLRPARTETLLGVAIPQAEQEDLLRSVDLEVDARDGALQVTVPTFRPDLKREVDLIEEVARLWGYDKLPSTLPPGTSGGLDPEQRRERQIKTILAGLGLHEAWTTSLGSADDLDLLGLPDDHPARNMVELSNPMSPGESYMRTTLLPGLLRSAARNHAHRTPDVALFEVARVYEPPADGLGRTPEQTAGGLGRTPEQTADGLGRTPEQTDGPLAREAEILAGVAYGRRVPQGWSEGERPWSIFEMKGVLEHLLGALTIVPAIFEPHDGLPFHPTRAARVVVDGVAAGILGELHPDVCDAFDVPERTVAFEIATDALDAGTRRIQISELPRFPSALIDLAVVVDEAVSAGAVERVISQAGRPELTSVHLFDIYTGEQIGEGKKSLAFALELRSPDRTLAEADVTEVRDRIVSALARQLNASLRS